MDNPPPSSNQRVYQSLKLLPFISVSIPIASYDPKIDGVFKFDPTLMRALLFKMKEWLTRRPISTTSLAVLYSSLIGFFFPSLWVPHAAFLSGFSSMAIGDDLYRQIKRICKDGQGQNMARSGLNDFIQGVSHMREGQLWTIWFEWNALWRSALIFLDSLIIVSGDKSKLKTIYLGNADSLSFVEGLNLILLSFMCSYSTFRFPENRMHTILDKRFELFTYSIVALSGMAMIGHSLSTDRTSDKAYEKRRRLERFMEGYTSIFAAYMGSIWMSDAISNLINDHVVDFFERPFTVKGAVHLVWLFFKFFASFGIMGEGVRRASLNIWDTELYVMTQKTFKAMSDKFYAHRAEFSAVGLSAMKFIASYMFGLGSYNYSGSMMSLLRQIMSDKVSDVKIGTRAFEMGKDVLSVGGIYIGYYLFLLALSLGAPHNTVGTWLTDSDIMNLSVGGLALFGLGSATCKLQYYLNENYIRQTLTNPTYGLSNSNKLLSYENIALAFVTTGAVSYGTDLIYKAYQLARQSKPQIIFNPKPGAIALASATGAVTVKHMLTFGHNILDMVNQVRNENRSIFDTVTDISNLLPLVRDTAVSTCALAASGFVLMKAFPSLKPVIEKPLKLFERVLGKHSRRLLSIFGSPLAAFTLFTTVGSYIVYKKYFYDVDWGKLMQEQDQPSGTQPLNKP